jgi:hypothetical protein
MSAWFDDKTEEPLLQEQARKLDSFLNAIADGKVTTAEVEAQEDRMVALMKKLEPMLSPEQHELVTQLLIEVTAYDLMQVMNMMQATRPSKPKLVL